VLRALHDAGAREGARDAGHAGRGRRAAADAGAADVGAADGGPAPAGWTRAGRARLVEHDVAAARGGEGTAEEGKVEAGAKVHVADSSTNRPGVRASPGSGARRSQAPVQVPPDAVHAC